MIHNMYDFSGEFDIDLQARHEAMNIPLDTLGEATMTEEECDRTIEIVREALYSDNMRQVMIDGFGIDYVNEIGAIELGCAGLLLIGLFAKLIEAIKNKYRLKVKKVLYQTKELNDLYDKVNDILKNDKSARRAHKNDIIPIFNIKYIIMRNKAKNTDYKWQPGTAIYNGDGVSNAIENAIATNASLKDKERKAALTAEANKIIDNDTESYTEPNGSDRYIYYSPMLKVVVYKNQKLEVCLKYTKFEIEDLYNATAIMNNYVSQYLEVIEYNRKIYTSLYNRYHNDKINSAFVDTVFKYILQRMTDVYDFNTVSLDVLTDCVKYYAEELGKIYNIIRGDK